MYQYFERYSFVFYLFSIFSGVGKRLVSNDDDDGDDDDKDDDDNHGSYDHGSYDDDDDVD